MSDQPVIEFRAVSKVYRLNSWFTGGIKNAVLHPAFPKRGRAGSHQVTALRDLSLSIAPGENFAIIGPNGSGKSTALGLVAGVLRPTSGQVNVKGRVSPLLELGAGFHPELSGRDNVILNGVLLGMTRRLVASKLESIVEFSGLREFIENPLRTYSSGMVARLGFSVVVHLDPEILLIDEVLAVGDAEFAQKCVAAINRFRDSQTTVVLVTHDMGAAQRLCQRAAVLDHGTLQFHGPSDEAVRVYTEMVASPQRRH